DTEIDELAIISPVLTQEVNKAGSFSFTVPSTHPYIDKIEALTSIVSIFYLEKSDTEHFLFCCPCTKVVETMYGEKQVFCEGAFSLFNRKIYEYTLLKIDMTSDTIATQFNRMGYSGFYIGKNYLHIANGDCNVTDKQGITEIIFDNYPTRLEALMKLQELFGGYFLLTFESVTRNTVNNTASYRFKLDYKKDLIYENTQELTMGQNLISMDVDIDEPNIFNTVYPVGAKSGDYARFRGTTAKIDALVTKYGEIDKLVTWDDVKSTTALTNLGAQYLKQNIMKTITAKAKFLDMSYTSVGAAAIRVGYKVKVYSPKQGIDRQMIVLSRTTNLVDPGNDTLTLSATEEYEITEA
ncbi:MAG: phage tail protein, partial [Clostridia bacterium]|nr:phage tail protein [Clostridia bacterium]